MQFSIARERYTPLLNSPRNLDGIVSRFLASRVCSKVPVKAKAHVVSRSRRGGQSTRGGGVGGAPPPRGGFARGKVPHIAPLCNTEPASRPTSLTCERCRREKAACLRGIPMWEASRLRGAPPAGTAAARRSARALSLAASRWNAVGRNQPVDAEITRSASRCDSG